MTKINFNKILEVRNEMSLGGQTDGMVIFNRFGKLSLQDRLMLENSTWFSMKSIAQADNILDFLGAAKEYLDDFIAGNFDEYIDEYIESYTDGDEEPGPFDPYNELRTLIGEGTYEELPEDIAIYEEMMSFIESITARKSTKQRVIESLFGKHEVTKKFMKKDEITGEFVPVDEEDVPREVMEAVGLSNTAMELENIESEHCMDSWNKFLSEFKQAIQDRKPFEEIRAMIVD